MGDMMEMKGQLLRHQDISPDPHQQLLSAFRDHDFTKFQNVLTQGVKQSYVDPDHWFDDPHYGSLLDLACSTPSKSQFVSALLYSGATPNKINPVKNKSPLHFTIDAEDLQSFDRILNDPRTDPNILDNMKNSPLHEAVRLQNTEFISKLLNHEKLNVNMANIMGQTALHIAAEQQNRSAAELLIQAGIDLDNIKNTPGLSGRDMVVLHIPELKDKVPSEPISKTEILKAKALFNMLYNDDTESFIMHLHTMEEIFLNYHDGHHTYLQLASERGFCEVVRILLQRGANPNRTCPVNNRTPLMLAGYRGNSDIVRLFIAQKAISYSAVDGENVLHSVINGIVDYQASTGRKNEEHLQCLYLVLTNVSSLFLDINYGGDKGNTPLHCAAKFGDPSVILLLLQHGAYIGQRNTLGKPAFTDIDPKILEYYLDGCVFTNDKLPREDDYEIIFKYKCLLPPKDSMEPLTSLHPTVTINIDNENLDVPFSETEPLMYMSHSTTFRYLLKHPVLSSFVHLKWHKVKKYFYLNLIFYVIFCILLTVYALRVYAPQKGSSDDNFLANCSRIRRALFEGGSIQNSISGLLRGLLTLFLILLVTREVFQLATSPMRYIYNLENWLEMAIIGFTITVLLGNNTVCQQTSAIAILLPWGELIILIGRHPASSTNLEMLKTVSLNIIKFLMWHSILIVAFALSFYMLFRELKIHEGSQNKFFVNPTMSFFKTILMATGEFDSGSITFHANFGVSHLLFVGFVFFIGVVLFDLLSGIAVDYTLSVRANAEFIGYISQLNQASYIETMFLRHLTLFKDLTANLGNVCSYAPDLSAQFKWLRNFIKIIILSDYLNFDKEINIFPNQNNKVAVLENRTIQSSDSFCTNRYKNINKGSSITTMSPVIMKAACDIIKKREEDIFYQVYNGGDDKINSALHEFRKNVDHYQREFRRFKEKSKKSLATMHYLLDLMMEKEKNADYEFPQFMRGYSWEMEERPKHPKVKELVNNWRWQHKDNKSPSSITLRGRPEFHHSKQ